MSMISALPVQRIEDGPTVKLSAVVRRADVPRSVIAKRPPAPYVATFMQQWLAGVWRPDHAYQGEKTDPMKPMIETARVPSSETPSMYHHA